MGAAACAPFSVRPAGGQEALASLGRWVRHMGAQVDLVRLTLVAGADRARRFLARDDDAAALLARRRLEIVDYSWFEAAGSPLRDGHCGAGPMRACHVQSPVLTKCLIDLRDRAEWVAMVDVDETWAAARQGAPGSAAEAAAAAAALTLGEFLRRLPPSVQQYHFCAIEGQCASDGRVVWRPKSALRVGGGECEWWAHAHAGIAVASDAAHCAGYHRGARLDVFKQARTQWDAFTSAACVAPEYYLNHSGRLYSNDGRGGGSFYRPGGPCDSTRPPSPEVIKQRVAPYGVPMQQLPQKTLGAQMLG